MEDFSDSSCSRKRSQSRSVTPCDSMSGDGDVLDSDLFPSDRGFSYRIGQRLEVQDTFGNWYPAKISHINRSNGMLRIHYDFWNSRHDELLQAISNRLRPSSVPSGGEAVQVVASSVAVEQKPEVVVEESSVKVGDYVFARWNSQPQAFPAKVLEIPNEGKYKLIYYDGFDKVVSRKGILKKMNADEISKLDLERFGQLILLPEYPSALFDPNIEKRNLGKRRSERHSEDVEGRKSAISARSLTPDSHDDLPLAMVMSPEDLTNDSSEVIVLDSKEKLMPLPKLEKPKVKPEAVVATKRGKPVDTSVTTPEPPVSSETGNRFKRNTKVLSEDEACELTADGVNEHMHGIASFSKSRISSKAPRRQQVPKKFITSTQKWKERKELKKRLQVKLMKSSSSNVQARKIKQNYNQTMGEQSESETLTDDSQPEEEMNEKKSNQIQYELRIKPKRKRKFGEDELPLAMISKQLRRSDPTLIIPKANRAHYLLSQNAAELMKLETKNGRKSQPTLKPKSIRKTRKVEMEAKHSEAIDFVSIGDDDEMKESSSHVRDVMHSRWYVNRQNWLKIDENDLPVHCAACHSYHKNIKSDSPLISGTKDKIFLFSTTHELSALHKEAMKAWRKSKFLSEKLENVSAAERKQLKATGIIGKIKSKREKKISVEFESSEKSDKTKSPAKRSSSTSISISTNSQLSQSNDGIQSLATHLDSPTIFESEKCEEDFEKIVEIVEDADKVTSDQEKVVKEWVIGREDWLEHRSNGLLYCKACQYSAEQNPALSNPFTVGLKPSLVKKIGDHEVTLKHRKHLEKYYVEVLNIPFPIRPQIAEKELPAAETVKPFQCSVSGCSKSFRKEIQLFAHIRHYHEKMEEHARPQSIVSKKKQGSGVRESLDELALKEFKMIDVTGGKRDFLGESISVSISDSEADIDDANDSYDLVRCTCDDTEEDGFMIQCEKCGCWQHGECLKYKKESDIPFGYTCFVCLNPPRVNEKRRARLLIEAHLRNRNELPCFSGCPKPTAFDQEIDRNANQINDRLANLQMQSFAMKLRVKVMKEGTIEQVRAVLLDTRKMRMASPDSITEVGMLMDNQVRAALDGEIQLIQERLEAQIESLTNQMNELEQRHQTKYGVATNEFGSIGKIMQMMDSDLLDLDACAMRQRFGQ